MVLLFADVEGSTELWASDADAISFSLRVHVDVVRTGIERRGAYAFSTAGDSFSAAFRRASGAPAAAQEIQGSPDAARWPGPMLRGFPRPCRAACERAGPDALTSPGRTSGRGRGLVAPRGVVADFSLTDDSYVRSMRCHRTRSHLQSTVSFGLTLLLAATGVVLVDAAAPVDASSSDFAITRLTDVGFVQADNSSTDAVVSDDGSTVVFVSMASNLVSPPPGGVQQVFVWNRASGLIELVSAADDGTPATGFSSQPRVSADGRYVIFVSSASNLVTDDTNSRGDVFVRDRVEGTTVRITADDAPYTFYGTPQLSDDGATAVVQGGAPGGGNLLEGEWQTGPLTAAPGVPTNGERAFAAVGRCHDHRDGVPGRWHTGGLLRPSNRFDRRRHRQRRSDADDNLRRRVDHRLRDRPAIRPPSGAPPPTRARPR